jgi:ankyrin repeat protein
MQNLWDWAKRNLTTEEIKSNLLLATDSNGETAWHVAASYNKLDVMQKLWEWAEENVTTEEVNLICFYPQTVTVKQLGMWQPVMAD